MVGFYLWKGGSHKKSPDASVGEAELGAARYCAPRSGVLLDLPDAAAVLDAFFPCNTPCNRIVKSAHFGAFRCILGLPPLKGESR